MFGNISAISTTTMETGAWNLFKAIGEPLLFPIGAIVLFGLVMFVAIAGVKSVVTR